LALIQSALEALDRADEAAGILRQEGLTFTTASTGAVHVHPALRIEKDARSHFLAAWRALALEWDAKVDGSLTTAAEDH
jgi:phage terminase small subunit